MDESNEGIRLDHESAIITNELIVAEEGRHKSKKKKKGWRNKFAEKFGDFSVKQAREKITTEDLAMTDSLTGLYNRRYFIETLKNEMAQAKRANSPLSLISFDIDFFKAVNDSYGHLAGDEVLRDLGKLIKSSTREGDVACRFGGEEFMILLPDTHISDDVGGNRDKGAKALAERLRESVKSKIKIKGVKEEDNKIAISVGVVMWDEKESLLSLFDRVDKLMYEAKEGGRDKVVTQPLE